MSALATSPHVQRLIELAFDEDLGPGDVTSAACIAADARLAAAVTARERCVVAGVELPGLVWARLGAAWTPRVADGDALAPGGVLGEVEGPARAVLAGERIALNFLQRLCGIATLAREAQARVGNGGCRVVDTRKTTPGWRVLEKHAVAAGGAGNHRHGLFDGVLIKDNHIAAVGSVAEAVRRARAHAHHLLRVEVEVDSLDQLEEALAAGAEVVLLDNMEPAQLREAVRRTRGRALLEASGGVRLENLAAIAATGVDLVSMGALTHSARAIDIGLDAVVAKPPRRRPRK